MNALIFDAGALVAVDRNDRALIARLRVAEQMGIDLRTSAVVVAQVWRDPQGRQATLARLLQAVDVRAVDESAGRAAGVLQSRANTSDPIDAILVLLAEDGDRILTSDRDDIASLTRAAGKHVQIVDC